MATNKKERERLREAMMKCLTITPKRQAEIAEMMKGRLGADERKPDQNGKNKGGRNTASDNTTVANRLDDQAGTARLTSEYQSREGDKL